MRDGTVAMQGGECCIVGGGVIGLSLAYVLSQRGWQVRVLDRGPVGREASWAGAGILPPANEQTAVHPFDRLRALSHRLHAEWAEQLRDECGIDNGYRRCGGLYVARSVGEAASLRGMIGLLHEQQIAVEMLDAAAVAELEPALKRVAESGELRAAFDLPDEAQIRNPDHLRALYECCRRRGVQIEEQVEVRRFKVVGGRLRRLETSAGARESSCYCLTAGAWTGQLLRQLDVATGIMPIRGQMLMLRCPRKPFRRIINEGPRYLVPRDDGRVLIGSTEEEVGFDKSTTRQAMDQLYELGCRLVPALRNAPIERSWAGLRPASYDGFPYIGPLPGIENAYAAAGHFRSGLHLSPGTAVVMGQLLCDEKPSIDLAAMHVGRG